MDSRDGSLAPIILSADRTTEFSFRRSLQKHDQTKQWWMNKACFHKFFYLVSRSCSCSRFQWGGLGLDLKLGRKVLFFVSILEGKSLWLGLEVLISEGRLLTGCAQESEGAKRTWWSGDTLQVPTPVNAESGRPWIISLPAPYCHQQPLLMTWLRPPTLPFSVPTTGGIAFEQHRHEKKKKEDLGLGFDLGG